MDSDNESVASILSEPEIEEVAENEVGATENQEQGTTENQAEDAVESKTKRVRNPQPKLNVELLRGPRGLHTLEGMFKNVKFKGRNHEEEDLTVLMKTYEYWCHRLFPKFSFDDSIERIEKMSSRKPLQVGTTISKAYNTNIFA